MSKRRETRVRMFIYVPRKVLLPAEPNKWAEGELEAAFAVLAEWEGGTLLGQFVCHFRRPVGPSRRFCRVVRPAGVAAPSFWFRTKWPSKGVQASGGATYDCQCWLRECAATDAARRPKAAWRTEALRRFPGLSKRAFERLWARIAPLEWKEVQKSRLNLTDGVC